MKRLISVLVVLATLLSIASISASAVGTLVFSDNFDNGFAARNWYTDPAGCAFKWDQDNTCIHGYRDAVVLQSAFGAKYNKWWDKFYASFDVQIRGFDEREDEEVDSHEITFWYHDKFEQAHVDEADGAVYSYTVCIETGEARLSKSINFSYKDENDITREASIDNIIDSGKIDYTIQVGEDAEWFNVGMRVDEGKIECYFNEQLVLSSSVEDGTEKIGDVFVDSVDASVGSQRSAILFWNGTCWIALDNFEVWTADYDFKSEINYGDVNADGKINMNDATIMLQKIAGWNVEEFVEAPADANGDGDFNLNDVTRLLQYIADWDVTLGPISE